jgi:hypothetical protein
MSEAEFELPEPMLSPTSPPEVVQLLPLAPFPQYSRRWRASLAHTPTLPHSHTPTLLRLPLGTLRHLPPARFSPSRGIVRPTSTSANHPRVLHESSPSANPVSTSTRPLSSVPPGKARRTKGQRQTKPWRRKLFVGPSVRPPYAHESLNVDGDCLGVVASQRVVQYFCAGQRRYCFRLERGYMSKFPGE